MPTLHRGRFKTICRILAVLGWAGVLLWLLEVAVAIAIVHRLE